MGEFNFEEAYPEGHKFSIQLKVKDPKQVYNFMKYIKEDGELLCGCYLTHLGFVDVIANATKFADKIVDMAKEIVGIAEEYELTGKVTDEFQDGKDLVVAADEVLTDYIKNRFDEFVENQKDIPQEYIDIINEHFWELI